MANSARGRIAVVQLLALAMMAEFSRVPAQYARVVAGTPVQHTLAADETVTYVYDGRPEAAGPDSGERYMLVEVRILVRASAALKRFPVAHPVHGVAQLTYEADGDQYPDPLLMVAFEAVPFIFYAENQFTTNATYYDQVAFQLVKTYHYVVVDRHGIHPGNWYITITNLPVWSQNSLDFRLSVTTSEAHPCPNRCSNHGTCTADGSCACAPGWGDSDCSQVMQPIALGTTMRTHLMVDEWQYYYVDPLAAGDVADDSSYVFADMEITSDPRCDALLYFKHEAAGFTELPTHYDFQYHSDSRSFYSYKNHYQVTTGEPILRGQYIIGIYNYNGRRIEADCDISLTVTACYTGDGGCKSKNGQHAVFETTTGWFLGLFLLAGLPLFCFVPFFYCIRRLRLAHQRRHGRDLETAGGVGWTAAAGGQRPPHGHGRPRPPSGLSDQEIASVHSFEVEPENGDQSTLYPNLPSDRCAVCLGAFEAGEM